MGKPTLKYLFKVQYTDGTEYEQNPEDHSVKFPPVQDENGNFQGKSCMADVFSDIEEGKVIRLFSLVGEGNTVTVDLITGIFHVNGLPILVESDKLPTLPEAFNLVYYRQRTENVSLDFEANKKGKYRVVGATPLLEESFCEYFLGWQCNISGKNYQQKIAVS